jgi:Tfp pilus assembly protein PilN
LANKGLLGIYTDKDSFQYVFVKKGMFGLTTRSPFPGMEPFGEMTGSGHSLLKTFLQKISGRARCRIYLALPRDLFFARNIRLPPIFIEDALLSVQNNLSKYCHLPLDEVYYDVHFSSIKNGINALIFYASRRKIDPYLQVFEETGMRSFLKGLFPLSFGIHAWLDIQQYTYPIGLMLPAQNKTCELALYAKEGFLYSGVIPRSNSNPDEVSFPGIPDGESMELEGKIFRLGRGGEPVLPPPPKNRCGKAPLLTENMGMAAVAPSLSRKQEISLDGRPTRLKYFHPAKVIVPLILVLAFGMAFLTWQASKRNSAKTKELLALQEQVQEMKKQVQPLQKNLEVFRRSNQFIANIDSFMSSRPNLYTVLNELAELVPQGTWFSNCSFERGTVTLRGTSSDAVKVLESFRKSGLFSQVKLIGAVSRVKTGEERFGLSMTLKKSVDEPKPKRNATPTRIIGK